ncbi:hypothetical protein [Moorena sp. SIO2C4]|nr:hypothetical protein [Moorena sp. SIO2C4]
MSRISVSRISYQPKATLREWPGYCWRSVRVAQSVLLNKIS